MNVRPFLPNRDNPHFRSCLRNVISALSDNLEGLVSLKYIDSSPVQFEKVCEALGAMENCLYTLKSLAESPDENEEENEK